MCYSILAAFYSSAAHICALILRLRSVNLRLVHGITVWLTTAFVSDNSNEATQRCHKSCTQLVNANIMFSIISDQAFWLFYCKTSICNRKCNIYYNYIYFNLHQCGTNLHTHACTHTFDVVTPLDMRHQQDCGRLCQSELTSGLNQHYTHTQS